MCPRGLAAVVAQAAVDYMAAKGEDWRTAEAFLKSEDWQASGLNMAWGGTL